MSTADIIIVIVVILIVLAIIFFKWIFPRFILKRKGSHCDYCPVGKDKKIKRALRKYRKERDKDKNID